MLKPYPFLKQDTYAWCLSIGLPVIWGLSVIFLPPKVALGLYMLCSLVWVLLDRLSLMKQEKTLALVTGMAGLHGVVSRGRQSF